MVLLVEGGQPSAGTAMPASETIRRVSRLSSHRLIATAEVYSDKRLSGDDAASAVRQPHLAGFGVEDLHPDAAAYRFVGDDARIRVEVVDRLRRMGEQRFVDRVLALDRQTGTRWKPSFSYSAMAAALSWATDRSM